MFSSFTSSEGGTIDHDFVSIVNSRYRSESILSSILKFLSDQIECEIQFNAETKPGIVLNHRW